MKNSAIAASILFALFATVGAPSISGCSAKAGSVDFGDDGGTGDDGGVVKADSGKHDSGGGGGGGGGMDSGGGGGGGDCTAFCMKEAAVSGCPTQSACEMTCAQSQSQVPASCQSQLSAVLQCAATTGMIASCSGSQAKISGCDSQITALTTCIQGAADSGGGGGGDGGSGSSTCGQIIQCANACTMAACERACVNNGTAAAQSAFNALTDCLFGANGTSGACGSMCGSQSSACTNCLNAAQMTGGACYTQVQTCAAN